MRSAPKTCFSIGSDCDELWLDEGIRLCEVADGGIVSCDEFQRLKYRAMYLFRSGGIVGKCCVVLRLAARLAQFSWSPMRLHDTALVVFHADDSRPPLLALLQMNRTGDLDITFHAPAANWYGRRKWRMLKYIHVCYQNAQIGRAHV